MLKVCKDPRLPHEHPRHVPITGEVGKNALDDDRLDEPLGALGTGQVHHAHSAPGQTANDTVPTEHHPAQHLVPWGHAPYWFTVRQPAGDNSALPGGDGPNEPQSRPHWPARPRYRRSVSVGRGAIRCRPRTRTTPEGP